MPRLSKIRFEQGPVAYELEIDWNDAAFVERNMEIAVRARRIDVGAEGRVSDTPELTATLSVVPGENGAAVMLRVGDKEVWRQDLSELFDESQVLDAIPAVLFTGEPITGCLLRSGLSAVAGQLVTCKNETAGAPWVRPRLYAISRCMRSNVPGMTGRAALRAALCIGKAGF